MQSRNPDTFLLPHCFLQYQPALQTTCASGLSIHAENYSQPLHTFESESSILHIVGNPILHDRIDPEQVARTFNASDPHFLRALNGEFLLINLDKTTRRLQIINDRFTAIPLYYLSSNGQFVGSVFYNDLWKWLQGQNNFAINEPAFFEFLWLQRILGTKTYDTRSQFLPAATCLTYEDEQTTLETYWSPSFTKTSASLRACTEQLGECLKQSIRRKTSDEKEKYGVFLSGGRDSRTVLAAFDRPPACFTLATSKNNEYRVAREIAELKDACHTFLPLDPDPYSDCLDKMVQLGGGMHVFDHAIFGGFKDQVAPLADVVFHGHGIDYMFQGMYVPTTRLCIGSKKTLWYKIRPLSEDLISDYLTNISYRLKDIDLLQFVKADYRESLYGSLRQSVQDVLDVGQAFYNTPYDAWEYLLMHALSRHYPGTNLSSMGTCAEQRTPTFDNDVFDLYLSLPPQYRVNAKIARGMLKYLDARVARVRTGNTNIQADFSPLQIELYRCWDAFLRKTRLRKRTIFWTPPEERTWPDRDSMLRLQPRLKKTALEAGRSEALASLGFLDMDALSRQVPKWLEQPNGGGAFMCFLITLDRFLKQ